MLDELFIDRMEGNEEIFSRVMTDKKFRAAAQEHFASEIFRRAQKIDPVECTAEEVARHLDFRCTRKANGKHNSRAGRSQKMYAVQSVGPVYRMGSSSQPRRISALRDRFRASWCRGQCSTPPA